MTLGARKARAAVLAATAAFLIPNAASADVLGLEWVVVSPTEAWLYAKTNAFDSILNADLGDTNIDLAPDGVNNGLYTSNGAALNSSSLTIEPRAGGLFAPRPLSITPVGTGSRLDAAWFTDDPAPAEIVCLESGDAHAVLLARITTGSPDTIIGGPNGGPTGDTQSRIYLGWINNSPRGNAAEFGVFDIPQIPSPAPALIAAPFLLAASRRRRPNH